MAGRRRAWHVYLLRCRDGSLYAGATNDLAARLSRHAAGLGARYTRSRLPVELVWSVRVRDRSAALRRELAVKRLPRAEKLALAGVRDPDADGKGGREPRARAPARPRAPG